MKSFDDQGFTLIEALIVLFIVSLLISLPYHHSKRGSISIEENLFFSSVEAEMNKMQLYAIISGRKTQVTFSSKAVFFNVPDYPEHPYNSKLDYPKTVSKVKREVFAFDFLPGTGRTNRFSNIAFKLSEGDLSIVFQISNGRYYIQKRSV